jgi:hypothetical protein
VFTTSDEDKKREERRSFLKSYHPARRKRTREREREREMSETPNAASNLLADLSAMLAGPASADGTTRRGSPGMSNDPVIAMKPRAASPLHKIAQQQQSRNTNGSVATSARRNTTDSVMQQSPMGGGLGLNQQERRSSYSLEDSPQSGPATETMVAYALKALTEEFMSKVDTMTHLFENLEGRMAKMESTLEQHTLSVNALGSSVDRNFAELSSNVKDVVRSVQLLKDKQELFEAQQEIARATIHTAPAPAATKEAETTEDEETTDEESLVESSEEDSEEEVKVVKKPFRPLEKAEAKAKKFQKFQERQEGGRCRRSIREGKGRCCWHAPTSSSGGDAATAASAATRRRTVHSSFRT